MSLSEWLVRLAVLLVACCGLACCGAFLLVPPRFVVVNESGVALRDLRLAGDRRAGEEPLLLGGAERLDPGGSFEVRFHTEPCFELRVEFTPPDGTRRTRERVLYMDRDEIWIPGLRRFVIRIDEAFEVHPPPGFEGSP